MLRLILLIVVVVSDDPFVSQPVGVEQVECPAELCAFCESNSAYRVIADTFQVPGHLLSASMQIVKKIEELEGYAKGEIFVTIGKRWVGVQVREIEETVKVPLVFNDLLDLELTKDHRAIEAFKLGDANSMIVRFERAFNSLLYQEVRIEYSKVESKIEGVLITQVWKKVNRATQTVEYNGTIDRIGGGGFVINSEFDRGNYEDFYMKVKGVPVFFGKIQKELGCALIKSPRGIQTENLMTTEDGTLFYEYQLGKYELTHIEYSAATPDFSVAAGVKLMNPTANLTGNVKAQVCQLTIIGELPEGYKGKIESDADGFKIIINIAALSLKSLEDWMRGLYASLYKILPAYEPEGTLTQKLYSLQLNNITLEILLTPEASTKISSTCKVLNDPCTLTGFTQRLNSNIETIIFITSISESSMTFLLNSPLASGSIISSTATQQYNSQIYNLGLQISVGTYSGFYFPNDFYISSPADEQFPSPLFQFLSLEKFIRIEPEYQEYFQGPVNIAIDGKQPLKFTAVGVELEDGVVDFKMVLEEQWVQPFGFQNLQMEAVRVGARYENSRFFDADDECVSRFYCKGSGVVCWEGQCQVELDVVAGVDSGVVLNMPAVKSEVIFDVIYSVQPSVISEGFEFFSSLTIRASLISGFFEANARFLGVVSDVWGGFYNDEYNLVVQMQGFDMGYGNIKMNSQENPPVANLKVEQGNIHGNMTSSVDFLSIHNEVSITITETYLKFSMVGSPFSGNYYLILSLNIIPTNPLQLSRAFVTSHLSPDDLPLLMTQANALLASWLSNSLKTLSTLSSLTFAAAPAPLCSCKFASKCSYPLAATCVEYTYASECIETYSSCSSTSIICELSTDICIQEQTTCQEWHKKIPDACVKYTTQCIKTAQVCQKWINQCDKVVESGCAIEKMMSVEQCLRYAYECNPIDTPDRECEEKCEYLKQVYDTESETSEKYQRAVNQTVEVLLGLKELNEIAEKFVVTDGVIDMELMKSGISNGDINVKITANVYCIDTKELEEFETEIQWDFFSAEANANSVFEWLKTIFASRSAGSISPDLLSKSAYELFLENLS